MKSITSLTNEKVKLWASLSDRKGIEASDLYLCCGSRLVEEALKNSNIKISHLLLRRGHSLQVPIAMETFELSPEVFQKIDPIGVDGAIAVCHLPQIEMVNLLSPPEGLEVLCPLSDPSNVGALVRSAAAFGASRIIFLKESAHPFLPKAIRAASHTSALVGLGWGPSIQSLSGNLVALDPSGEKIYDFEWPQNVRILVGEEGLGLPSGLKPKSKIAIPISRNVESLNATVSLSIALSEYRRQLAQR